MPQIVKYFSQCLGRCERWAWLYACTVKGELPRIKVLHYFAQQLARI